MRTAVVAAVIGIIALAGIIITPLALAGTQDEEVGEFQAPQPREIPDEIMERLGTLDTTSEENRGEAEKISVSPGGVRSSDDYLASGVHGVLVAEPVKDNPKESEIIDGLSVIDVAIGSEVVIPLKLTYQTGADVIDEITIRGIGVSGGYYIPSTSAHDSTPEERFTEMMENGRISGALETSSTVSFSPESITLTPNESQVIDVIVSIPTDWPAEAVGDKILYDFAFDLGGKSNVMFYGTPVYIKLVN